MEIYRLEENGLTRLLEKDMERERHLEERLVRASSAQIGDIEMLYINNQKGTGEGGRFDILGVDKQGDMVIVELKKGAAKRGVIAQALEYASKIREAEYSYFQNKYMNFTDATLDSDRSVDLAEAHAEHFGLDAALDPEDFNNDQRLIIIAADISTNEDLLRMADFLRVHDIDVVAVEYSWYHNEAESVELLTTDAIRQPIDKEPTTPSEDDIQAWKQRRADFWKEFQKLHRNQGLEGGTSNPTSASYAIRVFPDSQVDNPPFIRPAIHNRDEAYIEIRFYDKEFVHNEKNQTAFENAVAEATQELDIHLSPSIQDELVWETEEDRDFEKVHLNYEAVGSLNHANFTNQDELEDVRKWFVEAAQIYQFALQKMESTGRIEV